MTDQPVVPVPSAPSSAKSVIPMWETRIAAIFSPVAAGIANHFHLIGGSSAAQAAVQIASLVVGAAIYIVHGAISKEHAHKLHLADIGQYVSDAVIYAKQVANQIHPLTAAAQPIISQLEKLPDVQQLISDVADLKAEMPALVNSVPEVDRRMIEEALRQIVPANMQPALGLAPLPAPAAPVPAPSAPAAAPSAPAPTSLPLGAPAVDVPPIVLPGT